MARENKTKEQLIKEMQNLAKVKKYRAFVKDQFFPLVVKASTSVDDAKFWLTAFANMLTEQFLSKMKETKFSDMKLEEKLDKKDPHYEDFKAILKLFEEENVYSARELIDGMKGEIEMMITMEMKERKLDSLKTNFFEI